MSRVATFKLLRGTTGTLLAGLFAHTVCAEAPAPLNIGLEGCPMAHCDARMSDNARTAIPLGQVEIVWRRDRARGSDKGLGCSSNGAVAACTFTGEEGDNLVVYDYDGNRLWASGDHLNDKAWTSAPIVASDGSVLASDDAHLIRFSPTGEIVWKTPHNSGSPISPVLTKNGRIAVAAFRGSLTLYDSVSGVLLSELKPGLNDQGKYYHTRNTLCARDDRFYLSTQRTGINLRHKGRLYAIDAVGDELVEAWHVRFGSPSGASPLCILEQIYFDGDYPKPTTSSEIAPTIFAVRDVGAAGVVIWEHPVETLLSMEASFARDPRNGLWAYSITDPMLRRFDKSNGAILQQIDTDLLVGAGRVHVPGSALTIGGTDENPIMVLFAFPRRGGKPYVIAIDLTTEALLWKVEIAKLTSPTTANGTAAGQFPVLNGPDGPRIVFSTYDRGVFALGHPLVD